MKRTLLCLLLCAVMLCTTGCSDWDEADDPLGALSDFYQMENEEPEPEPLTAFTLPYIAGDSLDPVSATEPVQQTVGALLYEGLFALDDRYRPVGLLADSWEYDSGRMVWIIHLRSNAVFSDGSPVTAQDAAATLERARYSTRYSGRLQEVTSVSVRDGALVIALSKPLASLPYRLDIPIVKAGTENRTAPVGSGPYVFAKSGDGAHLTANTLWWQDSNTLPLTRIELKHCKDRDSALYAFSSREIQLLTLDLTGSAGTGVSGDGDYQDAATTVMHFVGMNTRRSALENAALRRAISAGIDRAALVSSCLLGHGAPAQLPASPAAAEYDAALETPYNAASYASLLNEALGTAKEGEKPLSLTLLVNEDSSFKIAAAQEVAASLTNSRLTVTVEAVPWDTFIARLQNGQFDLYYGECRLTADWDVSALVGAEGILNYSGYESEYTQQLLQSCRTARDNSRSAALTALWRQLLEDVPFAPVCFKSVSVLTTADVVEGLTPTETNPFQNLSQWTIHLDK